MAGGLCSWDSDDVRACAVEQLKCFFVFNILSDFVIEYAGLPGIIMVGYMPATGAIAGRNSVEGDRRLFGRATEG